MRSKSKADLKKLMSVSDSIADLNHKRFQQYLSADEAQHKIEQHPTGEDLFRPAVSSECVMMAKVVSQPPGEVRSNTTPFGDDTYIISYEVCSLVAFARRI